MALAAKHVRHFETLCRRALDGQAGIRLGECWALLQIWRSIVDANGKELAEDEQREVCDAIDSGDFDDLIPPDELAAYRRWADGDPQ